MYYYTILPVGGIIVALKDAHVTYEMLHTLAATWIAGHIEFPRSAVDSAETIDWSL